MTLSGLLFDIQGFSIHDGPGCRTVYFFKGCPLRCLWCCNPEGIAPYPEPMINPSRCNANKSCIDACPNNAIMAGTDGLPQIDHSFCRLCPDYACMKACPEGALEISGVRMTIEEVMKKVKRDSQYWGEDGGVTLSGGEPMLQFDFVHELLRLSREHYLHTAMETSGFASKDHFQAVLPLLDFIFYDLKHMDDQEHIHLTGVSNQQILENAALVASDKTCRVVFRIPLHPGQNDDAENLRMTAEFIRSVGGKEVNLLPLHHLGSSKYERLGREYPAAGWRKPDDADLMRASGHFLACGLQCYIGSEIPF